MKELLSTLWKTLFFNPFLNILLLLYAITGDNMGLAVILMAVLIRLLLLPSTKKQMEMTSKMANLRPQLDELKEKYKNNPDQLSKEQMKLYKESGYNPVGCLGSFLPQIIILAAIFGVIRTITTGDFSGVYEPVANFVFPDGNFELQNTQFLIWDLSKSFTSFTGSFLSLERLPYLLLAVGVAVVQFVSTKFTQGVQNQRKSNSGTAKDSPMGQQDMQAQMSKSMLAIFPLMTAYFTLSQPSVLGIYWFAQSLMLIVQYFLIDKETSVDLINGMLPWRKEEAKKKNKGKKSKEKVKEIEAKKVDEIDNSSENQSVEKKDASEITAAEKTTKNQKKKKKKRRKKKRKK